MDYDAERNKGLPYVLLDDIPFKVVEGSLIQVSPLAPFSSALQAGSSSRISDSRLSVEVWDNFTGGLGLRDETDLQVTSYAEGNFDTRVPGYNLPPPQPTALAGGALTGFTGAFVAVEHLESAPPGGTDGWLIYSSNQTNNTVKTLRSGVYTARPSENVYGFTGWNGAYYYAAWDGANQHLYKTVSTGLAWTTPVSTALAAPWIGLVPLDNKLVTYESSSSLVRQSLDGVTFTTHSTMPTNYAAEGIKGLFTWYNPQRTRDTLWAFTPYRVIWYEEESGEWHTFYPYAGVAYPDVPAFNVWRRDDNLYAAPTQNSLTDNRGFVQMFTGQVADDVSPNERFGLPEGFLQNVYRLQSNAHWLFAWGTGSGGGVYALNEFQGWTMLFDPRMLAATFLGGTGTLVGGGYDNGRLWAVVNDTGTYTIYELDVPDRRMAVPRTTAVYSGRAAYIRSGWTSHNQLSRYKIGAYFEVDFRKATGLSGIDAPLLGGSLDVTFCYRLDSTSIFHTETQTLTAATAMPMQFKFPNTPGINDYYRQLQWEIRVVPSGGASASANTGWALASVALYYTYWQGSYYAYQFNVDLSAESWYMEWPDENFRTYDRDELIAALFGFNETRNFHTFRYKAGAQEFSCARVDLLVAGREDAEMGGGIYSVTVRNLDT